MAKSNVRVEITSEEVTSRRPARVLVYDGENLVSEIIAFVEMKQGADGGLYPCVTITDNWFYCLLCGLTTPRPHNCSFFYQDIGGEA